MIRLSKPVKLMEWGAGTNTTNQIWIEMGKGNIVGKPKTVDGVTTIIIQTEGSVKKSNPADDSIKLAQTGEGMTPASQKDWGEVAWGRLKDINGSTVEVEIKVACKIGK